MANYTTTVNSQMSAEEAFDYLSDFSTADEWDANTVSSDRINNGAFGVGDKYTVVTKFAGREMTLTYETVEFERPNRVVLKSSNGSTKIKDTMTFKAAGSGSTVTYDANIELQGLTKVLDPVFTLVFKRVGDRAAEGLKEKLRAK